ncbi:HNH nuclease domain-containing protein [Pleurotus pulmonarius]
MITISLPGVSDSVPETRLLLEIPLEKIQSLCLRPAKWLRFVGWAIYHASEGYLSRHSDGSDRLTDDSLLVDGDFIFYHAPGFDREAVANTDVIAHQTPTLSRSTATSVVEFRREVTERDGDGCIFSNFRGQACHIIPFARGHNWISMLCRQRSIDPPIEDINDLRNGLTCVAHIHTSIDERNSAILVTPNPILKCSDIPTSPTPSPYDERGILPGRRYTIQHLQTTPKDLHLLDSTFSSNNRDARFQDPSLEGLPHPALLNYVYGVSILKVFGQTESLNAWKASTTWKQPETTQNHLSPRTFPPRGPRPTQERHQDQLPAPYLSASRSIPQTSRRRITADEAMDLMFEITLRQVARQEHAQWQQRKSEIAAWVNACAEGDSGSHESPGQTG